MTANTGSYEVVVGLEVHAQLLTATKLFCGDSAAFGAAPNTHVSPVTLGHPGTLPYMNRKAIGYAVKMGLACHCSVARDNYFARKHYFYPDLPKGYQVSQHTTPVCGGGFITIRLPEGEKNIRLNRIHLEEDAGKSIHDADPAFTCVDYNRAGTPLIEIVTEPDIRSGEEAFLFLTEIRKLVRYLDICDGNMEEGSLRCDANISVRKKGETRLGTKVEVKNLNSVRHVKKAIETESDRLIGLIESGEPIIQQTRSFDSATGTTFAIREKEDADDYRYFAEPDLTPFRLEEDFITAIRDTIPPLQRERIRQYTGAFGLSEYDASVLTEEKEFADYFEQLGLHCGNYKAAANWMQGPVKSWLNENNKTIDLFPLQPGGLASLVRLVGTGTISYTAASGTIFPRMLQEPGKEPARLAEELNLFRETDLSAIGSLADNVLEKLADKVTAYKKGKKGLLALFVGEVMKASNGKADPKLVKQVILEKLQSS